MHYSLNPSAARLALAAVFATVGALAWASLAAARADDAWRLPVWLGVAGVFVAVCAREARSAARHQPRGIRLMGAQRAILYYPAASRRRGAPAAQRAIDVRIERIVHWPGRLAGIGIVSFTAGADVRPAGAPTPREVLIFADAMPAARFHSLGVHLRCMERGVTLVEYR